MSELQDLEQGIPIGREVQSAAAEPGKYIDPPHAVILADTTNLEINQQDMIFTSVCWLVNKRPPEMPLHKAILTDAQEREVTNAKANPLSDQVLMFMDMAGLMTFVKEIKKIQPGTNIEYLKLRWKALCATTQISNMWEQGTISSAIFDKIINHLLTWQAWIKPHAIMRKRLILYALTNQEGTSLVQGALAQVKMILQNYGLRSVLLMEGFITAGSKAIFLPAIAQQVWTLKKTMEELKTKHGEMFPYVRVFPLEGADRLNHRNYPDLYYAAVNRAIKNKKLGPEGQYVMTEITTTIPKTTILDQAERTFRVQPVMDEVTKGYLTDFGIDPEAARRRRDDYDDNEEPTTRRRRT